MRQSLVWFCLTSLLLIRTVAAAPQVRDSRGSAGGTATISGVAVSDETDPRPVRRVRVTCTGSDFAATAITDDRGRFIFRGLKAGRYTIAGTKDAWVPSAYGAKRPLRPGSAIPMDDGQAVPIVLKMLRGSVLTGVLLDYNNQPAANTTVSAMRYIMQNGVRRLSSERAAVSDDRGIYRIYGLPPGDYLVGAAPRATALNAPGSELRVIDHRGERTVAFSATYFPGTTVITQASLVTLRAGEERDGIDFAVQLVPTTRVEGTVTSLEGIPAPAGTSVSLVASAQATFPGSAFSGLRSTRVGADGAFSFTDVSPGNYTVLARGNPPVDAPAPLGGLAQITWASIDIAVDGEQISGLALGLQPGMTLTGQLKFDATHLKPPASLKSLRIGLEPVQVQGAVGFAPSGAVMDDEGHFLVTGIIPGTYRLTVSLPGLGRPGGWYLRTAMVRGVDTADEPITIRPGESIGDATITLSDHPGQLTGTVHNAAGGAPNEFTVILFPVDRRFWLPQSRRISAARPSADGTFAFRGLPPGDYLLSAIDDVEPGEWFDPALLERLVANAMKLSIAEGENKGQDIRLGGG